MCLQQTPHNQSAYITKKYFKPTSLLVLTKRSSSVNNRFINFLHYRKGLYQPKGHLLIHTYLFEAKSIQSYIFATNKLKEIIGGSELIEQLTAKQGLLQQTLQSLSLEEGKDIKLSRCGGAAFYAFSNNKDAIDQLATLWPLVFRQYLPDMEFIHARAENISTIEAFKLAHERLMTDRNRPQARLPQANVYTLRFARTGAATTRLETRGKEVKHYDQITARKLLPEFANSDSLAQRVMWDSHRGEWPVNLNHETDQDEKDFPFTPDNRLIGLIHADGNGLGQLLMDLKTVVDDKNNNAITDKNYIAVFRDISESIKTATEAAAASAVGNVLFTNMERGLFPARPIVLGGDDLTMIVRADLALPFTQVFLAEFEKESKNQFDKIREKYPKLEKTLPEKLTACAGIVYAHSSQPFSALHELAEGLCKQAKTFAKKEENLLGETKKFVPSSLSFYRVTSTLMDHVDEVLKRELTTGNITLTRSCYAVSEHHNLPKLIDLLGLQDFLKNSEVFKGALRQITGLLHQSPEQAQRRYDRWKEVMRKRESKNWENFNNLRIKLSHFDEQEETGTDFNIEHKQIVPFEDVLSLIAVNNHIYPPRKQGQSQ